MKPAKAVHGSVMPVELWNGNQVEKEILHRWMFWMPWIQKPFKTARNQDANRQPWGS